MGWRLLACENGASPDCIIVVVVVVVAVAAAAVCCCCCCWMVNYFKRIIIVRGADLSECFSLILFGKNVSLSRPTKIVTFLLKNCDHRKTGC